jgi:type II secretory pathway component PulK
MRRRNERGAALIWAVATMTLVLLAISTVAASLAGQANAVRRMKVEAAQQDLERAGKAWARHRLRAGNLTQEETLELAGGTVRLRPGSGWSADLVIQVRGEAADKPMTVGR